MTLGEFIKKYREEHSLSVRYFASLSGISPQQIINIEKGVGNDGKPMTSTMKTYQKIARAVQMDEKDFMNMLNDNVVVNPSDSKKPAILDDDGEKELLQNYQSINKEGQKKLLDYSRDLLSSGNYQKTSSASVG